MQVVRRGKCTPAKHGYDRFTRYATIWDVLARFSSVFFITLLHRNIILSLSYLYNIPWMLERKKPTSGFTAANEQDGHLYFFVWCCCLYESYYVGGYVSYLRLVVMRTTIKYIMLMSSSVINYIIIIYIYGTETKTVIRRLSKIWNDFGTCLETSSERIIWIYNIDLLSKYFSTIVEIV